MLPSILPLYENHGSIYPKIPIVDVHVHLIGSSPLNGCYVSKRFQKSLAVRLSRLFLDFGKGNTPQEEDKKYVKRLLRLVSDLPDSTSPKFETLSAKEPKLQYKIVPGNIPIIPRVKSRTFTSLKPYVKLSKPNGKRGESLVRRMTLRPSRLTAFSII